ncbi:serine/threonine protein kinase [Streptomyces ipomoeae]|uniref:Serine/threonine protein kinase n=1 Tax=Streptomyces ipomoeae TaxID=103232 RepID=A0AAE8W265_9ACTN|nr:serine/threonine-protein kinase [Streptomyces ipomoeae]MDX2824079.1 serine/threonine-protein kinase [Streptomyces ipomoeae]MDX2872143.1 serine/threonine-protein kinase [Streptomyces ipomoeae]TQE33951.1 serine/threonine protein kinase [Streptomyces ipomoeae]
MNHATEVFQPLRADDPPVVAGYRLAARLGAGGMGRVYLSHTQGGRPVAIKVVRPELADDPAFRRRFGREIKAARRVRGAYTAELIDADADGTPPWLATLYVPGPSLAEAVARRGPLPVPAVLWLVAGVAEALQAIHGAGIVHRDLKPSNVLLAADGPRVIDFGISLGSDLSSHTVTGSTVGTPQFMAPEQASGDEVTAATDVFALGQTAAFAALGEPLYGDGPSVSVLYRIVHEAPDLSRLPEQLRPLIARCMATDPAERATLAEVVEWCRQRLGRDADAGGGPAVWREVTGPEVTVPAPVPHPTAAHTVPAHAIPMHPAPLLAPPRSLPTPPRMPRRHVAMITAAAVAAGAVLVAGLAWTVRETTNRLRDRDTTTSSTTGPTTSERSSEPSSTSESASGAGGGTAEEASRPSPTAPSTPRPRAYPQQWLDEKRALDIQKPNNLEDTKGDADAIRFVCENVGCALESDTSAMVLLYSDPGATLDSCRTALTGAGAESRELPLAAAAVGSEICVKHPSGDIALLVIQVKSTALWDKPGISFLTADMTVWRAAA